MTLNCKSTSYVARTKTDRQESLRYLISYPFILSATLHSYAGLLCFYLSQPAATRQFGQKTAAATGGASSDTNSESDEESSNGGDRSFPSLRHPQSGPITAESLGMSERLLRNALTHFEKALEREKETHGRAEAQDDDEVADSTVEQDHQAKLRLAHGTAKVSQMFIDEVSVRGAQPYGKLTVHTLDQCITARGAIRR